VEGYLLQDWTTITSGSTAPIVVQSEVGWLDLIDYRDIVFWLEVKARILGGATAIVMAYQTSPSKDENLFSSMLAFPTSVGATPDVRPIIESLNPTVPLCRWLRWQLQATGPTSDWSATFRIHCAVNRGGLR
jgi:hypothetical protein